VIGSSDNTDHLGNAIVAGVRARVARTRGPACGRWAHALVPCAA
jgi:hypothetical protein